MGVGRQIARQHKRGKRNNDRRSTGCRVLKENPTSGSAYDSAFALDARATRSKAVAHPRPQRAALRTASPKNAP